MLLSSDKILAIKTKTKGDNKNNFSGPSTINVKTKQKTPNKQKTGAINVGAALCQR